MCSATASMATTQLNVFAGAFTTEIYQRIFRKEAEGLEMVRAGRLITLALGGIVIAGALLIPVMGSYTGYILASVAILTGPLVLPTIWGLYSKKIALKTAWIVSGASLIFGLAVKIGIQPESWLVELNYFSFIIDKLQSNERVTDIAVGTIVPLALLIISEIAIRKPSEGWIKVLSRKAQHSNTEEVNPSSFPAKLCAWSTIVVGLMMALIGLLATENKVLMILFGGGMAGLGGAILLFIRAKKQQNSLNKIGLKNR